MPSHQKKLGQYFAYDVASIFDGYDSNIKKYQNVWSWYIQVSFAMILQENE